MSGSINWVSGDEENYPTNKDTLEIASENFTIKRPKTDLNSWGKDYSLIRVTTGNKTDESSSSLSNGDQIYIAGEEIALYHRKIDISSESKSISVTDREVIFINDDGSETSHLYLSADGIHIANVAHDQQGKVNQISIDPNSGSISGNLIKDSSSLGTSSELVGIDSTTNKLQIKSNINSKVLVDLSGIVELINRAIDNYASTIDTRYLRTSPPVTETGTDESD